MAQQFGFVTHERHRIIPTEVIEEAQADGDVTGLLLAGSVARGDAGPSSDLDIYVLLRDGCARAFRSEVRQGLLVEYKSADFARAHSQIERSPMEVYAYLTGRVLRDEGNRLAELTAFAHQTFQSYKTPGEERRGIRYWLQSADIKVRAALEAGEELKAAFIVGTTSWKMLEGVWAVNDRPMPPSGGVKAHLADLTLQPPPEADWFARLFLGDTSARIETALDLIGWLAPLLGDSDTDHEEQ